MDIIKYLLKQFPANQKLQAVETGTIRNYTDKHESTRIIGENINGSLISIDKNPKSIQVSQDICKHLDNIEWREGDSLTLLAELQHDGFDFVLLDSVNNEEHIFKEFQIACKLCKKGGTILIDDFGVGMNGQVPDWTHHLARKGRKIYQFLQENNLLHTIVLYQSTKGVQGLILNMPDVLKNWEFKAK